MALLLSRGSVTCTQDYYLSQEYTTTQLVQAYTAINTGSCIIDKTKGHALLK